ncbi:MAG: trigger factor [Lactobacillales bacterium]|jgi:trigger factor|nr:trigger factor [Lactobacillales bacterium]
MTAKFEKTGTNEGTLTFSISQEEIKPALDKAFKRIQGKINEPGFRKGKLPRAMFNQKYGEESLYEDALNLLFSVAYETAAKEAGILNDLVGQPSVSDWKAEKGQDWELTVTTTVKPEVKLGEYKNLTVPKQDTTVTDEDVEARVEYERDNLAELVLKEDEGAVDGDTVVVDFEGFIDGEPFNGGKDENYSLVLGSGSFIPGFEEQLVGHKAGEEVDVTVIFPEDYQAENLANKEAVFKTVIHEVKAKELPELDDDFAKDVDDEVETLDELKEKYRKELTEQKETAAADAKDEAAIRQAVENAEIVELPQEMVHEEVHNQMNQFLGQMQQQGISPEMYYQLTGTTEDDLHKQYEAVAEDRVRTNLVIEAIAKAEGFGATDEEIDKEIKELSDQYGMPVEQIKNVLSDDMLRHDITMKKAIEAVTETAVEK